MAKATLINAQGKKVVVTTGSPEAQKYFSQGYQLMGASGKYVSPKTSAKSTGKQATLYGPSGQKKAVPVGSAEASALQSYGWGLNPKDVQGKKWATLYGPNGEMQAVEIGSKGASTLQTKGWGLTKGSYKEPAGPDPYAEILKSMRDMLEELKKRGQTVNPAIEITPEKAAEFMQQAEGEINPYYSGQLKLAKEDLLASVGYTKDEVTRFEQDIAKKFKQGFQQVGEQKAEEGFALSGRRMKEEGQLAEMTQEQIDANRRILENRTGELSRAFARQYAGLPGYEQQAFNIGGAPKVSGTGAFELGTGENPIYTLSPEIYNQLIGSQEFERRGATSTRQSELEAAFRESEALKQQRALTI